MTQKRRSKQKRSTFTRRVPTGVERYAIEKAFGAKLIGSKPAKVKGYKTVTLERGTVKDAPQARGFKGKVYLPSSSHTLKSEAQAWAKQNRGRGELSRISREGGKWIVWYRKPGHPLFKQVSLAKR